MFGHAGCNVSMVMLDPDQRNSQFLFKRFSILGGKIIRMKITGDKFRFKSEEPFEPVD
jgi:hypothetical protein